MQDVGSNPVKVAASEAINLKSVTDLCAEIAEALSRHSHVEIDCSAVGEVDLSGAQLLVAALKSARATGCRLDVVQPSGGGLARVLARAGLAEAFEGLLATCSSPASQGRPA